MKENNGFWRKAGVITTIVVIAVTVLSGYILVCGQVRTNQSAITELKKIDIAELKEVDKMSEKERRMTDQAVIRLQADVDYIKQGIDDIKEDLRER